MIKTDLQKLKFSCKNKPNGCKDLLEYKNVVSHNLICPFQLIPCSGVDRCSTKVFRKSIKAHEANCGEAFTRCEQCGVHPILHKDLPEYISNSPTCSGKCNFLNSS